MSDYPTQRPGFTRTGKSLKAVRRYYAIKNMRKQTPDDREAEINRKENRERTISVSKRKRSPDDDKLSKRIAAELRVQQEVLERRKDRDFTQLHALTERSALPIVIKPRETGGPTFVSEPERSPPQSPSNKSVSAKSLKSTKSNRSAGAVDKAKLEAQTFVEQSKKLSIHSLGCVVICFVMGAVFLITWLFKYLKIAQRRTLNAQRKDDYSMFNVSWMACASLPIILAVPYFLIFRENFKHCLLALVLMVGSTFGITAFFIYTLAFYQPLPLTPKYDNTSEGQIGAQNPLIFWFSVNYLAVHLLAIGLMLKQVMYAVSKQVDEKSASKMPSAAHMSMYLSPS